MLKKMIENYMTLKTSTPFSITTFELKEKTDSKKEIHIKSRPKYFQAVVLIVLVQVLLQLIKYAIRNQELKDLFIIPFIVVNVFLLIFIIYIISIKRLYSAKIDFDLKKSTIKYSGKSDFFNWNELSIPKNVMLIMTHNFDDHKVMLPSRGIGVRDKKEFYRIYLVEAPKMDNPQMVADYISSNYYEDFQSENHTDNKQIKTFIQIGDEKVVQCFRKLLEVIFNAECSHSTVSINS